MLTRQNWQIPVNELTQISVRGHSALMQLKHVNVALTLTALYFNNTGLKTKNHQVALHVSQSKNNPTFILYSASLN